MGKLSADDAEGPLCEMAQRSLVLLDLSNNSLSGPIPGCLFAKGSKLQFLDLGLNDFSGSIPDTFAKGGRLQVSEGGAGVA